jgi:hypothetical protein
MRFPWNAPRPTWHYVFRNGVECDYPIAEDTSRPATLRAAWEHPEDVETIELRLGDNCLAYATVKELPRVGICTEVVFDIPEAAHLYHALCRRKVVNAGSQGRSPGLLPGTGFVLGWRTEKLQRRLEVWVDEDSSRINVVPCGIEPITQAWIEEPAKL